MKAVQVPSAGGGFEAVEKPIPEPAPGEVRIRVEACGVCHSDMFTAQGLWPGVTFPRVPGHEIIGRVDALGEGAKPFQVGQRVGVGWFGGNCGHCPSCRRGDPLTCTEGGEVPGITRDGGYAEYVVAPANAVASVPDELDTAEAAPLMCAGITVYNALRHSRARPGDRVAILGIGGLGHLAVQFAARMGFETIAIARGAEKGPLAKELGAKHYIDSTAGDVAQALQALGGARVILATVTNADAMTAAFDGLEIDGEMIVVGAVPDPIRISPFQLIPGRKSLRGWPSGIATDSEDTLRFAALANVAARIERFPLAKAADAYERMLSGDARFRVVITP